MATKKAHVAAILAMRLDWNDGDRLLAEELAGLRFRLEKERKKAEREPATVTTGSGGVKPNPVHAMVSNLADQESRLTRRLNLTSIRNARGRYETATSPLETRQKLWEFWGEHSIENLLPGCWAGAANDAKCSIREDWVGWPNNPKTLPVAGETHEVSDWYPVAQTPHNMPDFE